MEVGDDGYFLYFPSNWPPVPGLRPGMPVAHAWIHRAPCTMWWVADLKGARTCQGAGCARVPEGGRRATASAGAGTSGRPTSGSWGWLRSSSRALGNARWGA